MEVKYIDHMGSDLSVVNAARVSFNKYHEEFDEDRDEGLIHYLAKHGHTSPFNHTFITLHVKAPVFVARQLVKHKFMLWNEVSRRYVDDEPEFYVPEVWRGKSKDKKQGSEGVVPSALEVAHQVKCTSQDALNNYRRLLLQGVCPEQARMILPLNTYTEWYWSGTLGAWVSMYNLRSKPDTQQETQEIARQVGDIIQPLFPVSWSALTLDKGKDL